MYSRIACIVIALSTGVVPLESATGASHGAPGAGRFTFLPEMYMSGDLSRYLLPKNDYVRKQYFLEGELRLEPLWVSYKDLICLATTLEVDPRMGQKGLTNVLFDPLAIQFAFTTVFELRLRPLKVQLGEDHRCFHEVDRKDFPTVYWNMLYLAAASPNMRLSTFGPGLFELQEWTLLSRFAWYVRWGVFLKGLFDIVSDSNVNYENGRIHEATCWVRYAFFRYRRLVLSVVGTSLAGLWEGPEADGGERLGYWQQEFGLEASMYRPGGGCMLFANYFLDDMPLHREKVPPYLNRPRFGKDRLLEIGVRIFK